MGDSGTPRARMRRPPPPFRRVEVRRVAPVTPRLVRVTLAGPELAGFALEQPAASVRLLFPPPDTPELVMPTWTGNEFVLPDGSRPLIRTFTPRRVDQSNLELDLEIVAHGHGAAAGWASGAGPGDPAAVSGPGRGYIVDPGAPAFVLAGDETAAPAIGQLLEWLPPDVPVEAHIEIAAPEARFGLPDHPRSTVVWHENAAGEPGDAMVAALTAVTATEMPSGARVWVAGEAASVQRARHILLVDRGWPRAHTSLRGYWKRGRAGGDSE